MRFLAAIVLSCALAPSALASGRPVTVLTSDVVVDRHAHVARASAVVSDDATQLLDRRYRTTLRYRCGGSWRTAKRILRGPASATISWRYPKRLARRRCDFRLVVTRIGEPHQARSAVMRRRL